MTGASGRDYLIVEEPECQDQVAHKTIQLHFGIVVLGLGLHPTHESQCLVMESMESPRKVMAWKLHSLIVVREGSDLLRLHVVWCECASPRALLGVVKRVQGVACQQRR